MTLPRQKMDISALAAKLRVLHQQAEVLGLFTNTRDLLECLNCSLQEDVTFDGRLITCERTVSGAPDTGLRFSELSNGQFMCPRCSAIITTSDLDKMYPDFLEHPINPSRRTEIETRLSAIEAKYDVHVLYACEGYQWLGVAQSARFAQKR